MIILGDRDNWVIRCNKPILGHVQRIIIRQALIWNMWSLWSGELWITMWYITIMWFFLVFPWPCYAIHHFGPAWCLQWLCSLHHDAPASSHHRPQLFIVIFHWWNAHSWGIPSATGYTIFSDTAILECIIVYHSVSWCIGITPSIVHWPLFLADLSSCETKNEYSNPKPTA